MICLKGGIVFRSSERLKITEKRSIAFQLCHIGHSAQYGDDSLQRACKTQCPFRRCVHRRNFFYQLRHFRQRIPRKHSSLDRFHDDDRQTVFAGNFIDFARLDGFAFPIGIIDLKLHKIQVIVFGKDAFQCFGSIVKREADRFGFAVFLQGIEKIPQSEIIHHLQFFFADGMEQIAVKICQPRAFLLFGENLSDIRFFFDVTQRHFICHAKCFPGITLHHGFAHDPFRFSAEIEIGGIEPAEPPFQITVHHFAYKIQIDFLIRSGQQRQAHHPESQFFFCCFSVFHDRFLPFLRYDTTKK